MKLSHIVQETATPTDDPFALDDDWPDRTLLNIINPKGGAATIDSIIDREMQIRYLQLKDQEYGWNAVRAAIETTVEHSAPIQKLHHSNIAAVSKYSGAADMSNRLVFGAITSIDLNAVPKEFHEWLYKQKAKADHAMEMSNKARVEAESIATKLFAMQRKQRAAETKALKNK